MCCVLAVERIKVKTNLVFQIFLVVVYCFMDSQKHESKQMQDTNYQAFLKGESVKLSMGKLCSLLMVNAEKFGAKIKKWGRCQRAIV